MAFAHLLSQEYSIVIIAQKLPFVKDFKSFFNFSDKFTNSFYFCVTLYYRSASQINMVKQPKKSGGL